MALVKPVNYPVEQDFDGAFSGERPGWIKIGTPSRGKRTSFLGGTWRKDLHLAIDYACPEGTPVKAMHSGKIVSQGYDPYSGNAWFVHLQMRVGLVYKVDMLFYHLKANSLKFRVGDKVKANDIIALSGNTGWSTGPHLHIEMVRGLRTQSYTTWYQWMRYDPQPFIDGMDLTRIAP